ncbi:DUF4013 domain-containing protein [Halostagnicola sp. A-GB9-2]|uniref:DUF4013 domain-containing protein n=1 Tax=Halostagnicola sp. A-GB9-2 TaxID=3048066 RepID=UPI0024C043EF|nr:DUF4013 domain-containing protein [Halostagnicola sp. A-GB9-2]MDJ1434022.1 DUF4013 domain-containing protein [Halostagnicola sp. A-GB9-2]
MGNGSVVKSESTTENERSSRTSRKMLVDALKYPTRGTPALGVAGIVVAIAIGYRYTVAFVPSVAALVPGTATMIAFAVLVGYLSHVLVDDDRAPPPLKVGASLRSGFKSLGISVVFLAIPLVLMFTTVSSFVEAGSDGGEIPAVFMVSSTAMLFLFLVSVYALPAAVVAATKASTMRAAFDREQVFPALRELPYVTAWITGFTLFVIGLVPVSITIGSADVAGLLSSLFGAYLVLAGSRIIATGYRRATTNS